jgi:predicted protein tyrosine phosphatase
MTIQSILDKNRSRSRGPVYDPIAAVFDRILLGPGLHLTPRFIRDHHVTHIVNCAEKAACPAWASTHVGPSAYIALEAEDSTGFPLLKDFYPTFENVMDMFLREPSCRCVYVHCMAGMNRSATLLAAYLHKRFGIPMEKVVEVMARQRPCVMTNPSFVEQLEEFGSHGKNK